MHSFDSYERNLSKRLQELRNGDRAYEAHGDAIIETLPYAAGDTMRILDIGCGLGFIAAKMAASPRSEVVGIDPSEAAIEIARKEHSQISNLTFYASNAQDFPEMMQEAGEQPFDRSVINMVLHSIDDNACIEVLDGARRSMHEDGILTLVFPDKHWLMNKLVQQAQANGMEREEGILWVMDQLDQEAVDLKFGIAGEPMYDETITVYNRTVSDYRKLVTDSGFGLNVQVTNLETGEVQQQPTAFWEWSDHTNGHHLATRDRHIVMTQVKTI